MSFETESAPSRFLQRLCLVLISIGSVQIAGCDGDVPIAIITGNETDRVIWLKATVPTLQVVSPSGIGSVTLQARNGDWPDTLDVTLSLAALEGFVVRNGDEVHRLELTAERRVLLDPADSALQMRRPPSQSSQAGFTVRITPARFAEPVSELVIEWVDYYR